MPEFEYPHRNKHEEESAKRKLPEFVYVEEEGEWRQEEPFEHFKEHFSHSAEMMKKQHYPLALRIFCLIGSLFLFAFTFFVLIYVALSLVVNILTFFRMRGFWERTKSWWGALKKTFVTSSGLLVAVFSPAFGLAIIMVYFLLLGQSMDEQWATRILKSRLYRQSW